MTYINNEIINQIRSAVNIVDVIGSYVPLTSKGRNFFGVCPFHDDHSPSMSVSPEKQIYTCFSCGASGNVFTFIQDYENISFVEAVQKLSSQTGISLGVDIKDKKQKIESKEYEILNLTQLFYKNNLLTEKGLGALKYLKNRAIDEKIIEKFGIGLAPNEEGTLTNLLIEKGYNLEELLDLGLSSGEYDTFKNRIMFPITNQYGQIVGYSGRIFNNENNAKYVNSKASSTFKKGEILYNYHQVKDNVRKVKYVLLVEGFMDVIRLSINGINNSVALMGTAITDEQINLLKQLRTKVILCLDSDAAGEMATMVAGEQLTERGIITDVIRLEGYKDPDDYLVNKGKEAFLDNVNNASSYLDYKIKYLKNESAGDSEKIAHNVNIMIETINKIKDPILRGVITKKVSEEFGIKEEIINNKLTEEVKQTIVKQEPLQKEKLKKSKKTRIEQACEAILYLMANDIKYINLYIKQIGYLPIDKYKRLALEIQSYHLKNKSINLADFLSYIADNEEYKEIMNNILIDADNNIHPEEFDAYRGIIMSAINKKRIDEYKDELSKTSDSNHKKDILSKIAEIKKKEVE